MIIKPGQSITFIDKQENSLEFLFTDVPRVDTMFVTVARAKDDEDARVFEVKTAQFLEGAKRIRKQAALDPADEEMMDALVEVYEVLGRKLLDGDLAKIRQRIGLLLTDR